MLASLSSSACISSGMFQCDVSRQSKCQHKKHGCKCSLYSRSQANSLAANKSASTSTQ